MGPQKRELLFGGCSGHDRSHRVVQRVERGEWLLGPSSLCDPRRALEYRAKGAGEAAAIGRVEVGQCHAPSILAAGGIVCAAHVSTAKTISPSTRTSRTLSEPPSVNSAASACVESVA